MSYNYRQNIQEELKPEEINLNFQQLMTKLEEVKSKSTLKELTFLCQEMINFLKKKEEMIHSQISIDKERPKFLYHSKKKRKNRPNLSQKKQKK